MSLIPPSELVINMLFYICTFQFVSICSVFDNEVTGECCPHLMAALMSERCSLSELDLSVNDLGQEGALLLCKALSRSGCPLKKLWYSNLY